MKTFRQVLLGTEFPITAELHQPTPATVDEILQQSELLAATVDAIQVTQSPCSGMRVSPSALAALLIRQGIDPIPWLTCRDRNRIALQSDLLGLRALGVTSLFLGEGRQLPPGLEPLVNPVFDLNGREFIAMAHAMNEEEKPESEHEFVIGTRTTVLEPGPDWAPESLIAQASAGARFLQTQPCFDLAVLRRFMQALVASKLTWSYSIIVTLAPLPSAETARWLLENTRDAVVPDSVVDRMARARNPEQAGIDLCADLMQGVAAIPGVSGINLLTLGNPRAVTASIEASGLTQ